MSASPENDQDYSDPKMEKPLSDSEKVEVVEKVSTWLELAEGSFANA